MSVHLMESLTAAGFGFVDDQVQARVTRRLPGGIPAGAYFEGLGILVGMFGQKVGLGADVRDPIMMSALALAGARASRLARANKLFTPSQWGSVGGDEGGDSGGYDGFAGGAGNVPVVRGRQWAPGIRRIGRGGVGTDLSPYLSETGGVAG